MVEIMLFFKQKTAYEVRISDWSSDVCSSDLAWQFLGEALGANPTPMAYAEVYTGLQTGAIDGQDNPLPNVENMKFYEVMSQIVLTAHLVGFDLLTVSSEVWNDMSPEVQQRFQAAADAAIDFSTEKHLAREAEDRKST